MTKHALGVVVVGVFLSLPLAGLAQPAPTSPLGKKFYFSPDPQSNDRSIVKISSKVDAAITDDDLKELAQFPDVKAIYLNGSKITGVGIKHFAGLKKLDTLEVAFCAINAEGFQEIAKLKQLKRLDILNTNYTDADLKGLMALSDLEMLWMGQNFKCSDDGYKVLGKCKKLRGIAVSNSNFGDGALKVVAELPELRTLIIVASSVTVAGLEPLTQAAKLERFYGNFRMGAKGLAYLGKIDSLREIDLYGAQVTADDILAMPNVKKLTMINPDFREQKQTQQDKLNAALPNCKFTYIRWRFDQ